MGCGERAGQVTKGALGDYPGGFSYTGSQSSGITQKTGKSCNRICPTRSEECGRGPGERSQQVLQEHWASQLSLRENDQKDPIYEGRKGLIHVAGQCGFPRLFVLGCFPQRPLPFTGFRKLSALRVLTHTQSWEEDSIHTYTHILRGNWHHRLLMQINFLLQNRNGQPRIIRCRKKPKKWGKIPNQNLRKLKFVSSGESERLLHP